MGPCSEIFGGTYGNIDVFYKIAECLGLSQKAGQDCETYKSDGNNWNKYQADSQYGYHQYTETAPLYGKNGGSK